MCSSPKPKRSVSAGTKKKASTILSSLSVESRQRFVERANKAADRRFEIEQHQQAQQQKFNKRVSFQTTKQKVQKSHWLVTFWYWLNHTNITQLFHYSRS